MRKIDVLSAAMTCAALLGPVDAVADPPCFDLGRSEPMPSGPSRSITVRRW